MGRCTDHTLETAIDRIDTSIIPALSDLLANRNGRPCLPVGDSQLAPPARGATHATLQMAMRYAHACAMCLELDGSSSLLSSEAYMGTVHVMVGFASLLHRINQKVPSYRFPPSLRFCSVEEVSSSYRGVTTERSKTRLTSHYRSLFHDFPDFEQRWDVSWQSVCMALCQTYHVD